MLKTDIENQLNNHPNFSVDRLYQLCDGKRLTTAMMWEYLCELRHWKPLEVVQSNHPDWVLVASGSEVGKWHRTSAVHQACDCRRSETQPMCCHLSAAMAHEESEWIAYAQDRGFEVQCHEGVYQISDRITQQFVGGLSFNEGSWWLMETRHPEPTRFVGVHEAIEYLAAVASFGWQLG